MKSDEMKVLEEIFDERNYYGPYTNPEIRRVAKELNEIIDKQIEKEELKKRGLWNEL